MADVTTHPTDAPPVSPAAPTDPSHATTTPWWRDAVIYQVYPRSFADSDGDGMGDLPGITAHLDHLADLGVDALWISPFYTSPQADAGYDVADYRDVDPQFGTLADADALLARAHELGLRVIVDLVPNHSSDEHPWFRAALTAAPGSDARNRYLFRDGRGPGGSEPPNNWESVFGGPAWTRVTEADGSPGQWYLHLFDARQPDFNWDHPAVRSEFEAILRFWLERGVDGFRVDVAHGLVKKAGLPDHRVRTTMLGGSEATHPEPTHLTPYWDQDGVHEIYRAWRRIVDGAPPPERILCAEAWVEPADRLARYTRPDEMHQAFNFDFLGTAWRAPDLVAVIERSLAAAASVGAPSTWVLSNHDVIRHASRLGFPPGTPWRNGIAATDPQPDRELGLRRARAATALMLALPGGAYLYQGEELGLPESTDMPDAARQDPTFARTRGAEAGRDGCRVPLPWVADAPGHGFGPGGDPWLPQPDLYREYAVDQQEGVPGSTLELYRLLLATRRDLGLGSGSLRVLTTYAAHVVALEVRGPAVAGSGSPSGATVLVLTNLGTAPVPLPAGGAVLLASGDLVAGAVPTDTTAWVRMP